MPHTQLIAKSPAFTEIQEIHTQTTSQAEEKGESRGEERLLMTNTRKRHKENKTT